MCEKSNSGGEEWKLTISERQLLQVIKTLDVPDQEDQDEETQRFSRTNNSSVITKSDELEKSGVFIAGYRGPIHRWEHPGYQYLTQQATGRKAKAEKAYKVIIVGDATVGKTSFVQRYVNDVYRGEYKGTVGGQERFTWMTRAYYRDAQGCIVMFDLANCNTFKNTTKWKHDVDSKCQQADGSALPAVLLGNKCDLPTRDVNQEDIEATYKKDNYLGWTEISAKESLMVEDSMKFLIDAMVNADSREWSVIDDLSSEGKKVKIHGERKKKRKCC